MQTEYEGGCQCGAIRYRVRTDEGLLAVCHCTECQRQSGSAFGMSLIVDRDAFTLLAGVLKTFTRTSDSGRTVMGAFCPECGTRIFHEPRYLDGVVNVKPGTLDDTSWLTPSVHAWTGSKQAWLRIPEGVAAFERQP